MTPGHILQIHLRVTVQNQIRITQWVIVDEVVQFGLLGHEMCIRDRQKVLRFAMQRPALYLNELEACMEQILAETLEEDVYKRQMLHGIRQCRFAVG